MRFFDVAVIGAGPGGYVAAIRAAQLGLKTVCIDDWTNQQGQPALGGTCLNVGCIPSKALLESSENLMRAREEFASHGIRIENISLDLATMLARKDRIVETHTKGIAYLFKKNKVESIHGHARFKAKGEFHQIEIENHGVITARFVIIATGSKPKALQGADFDGKLIVDNAGALAFSEVPKRLGIVGAGVIGLELGDVWRRLGSEVTLLESSPDFLPVADEDIAKEAFRIFKKRPGWRFHTAVTIKSINKLRDSVKVEYENESAGVLEFDKLIVAIGRTPNTGNLDLERIGIELDEHGQIEVDAVCQTKVRGVFAIGDLVRGPKLAHKASEEGVMVAERIAGQKTRLNLDSIPSVIYTSPEIAWVGMTERQLKESGAEYRSGRFPFSANGRAQSLGETAGFVKILSDARTDRIVGVHIIGPFASELITEAVVAIEFLASSEDIARIVHAHPSLSEAMHEAALAVDGRALHL